MEEELKAHKVIWSRYLYEEPKRYDLAIVDGSSRKGGMNMVR